MTPAALLQAAPTANAQPTNHHVLVVLRPPQPTARATRQGSTAPAATPRQRSHATAQPQAALARLAALLLAALGLTHCALPTDPERRFDPKATSNSQAPKFTTLDPEKPIDPAWLQPSTAPQPLGPGDQLDIDIVGEPSARAQTFITPDGKLYYDLLPGITAAGRTPAQLQADLETALRAYHRHPQVSLDVTAATSQRVTILGRVNTPGTISLDRPMRVLDAVSAAGGFFVSALSGTSQELADLSHSFLIRDGQPLPIDMEALFKNGDLSQNIYLRPRDYLYFPSALNNEIYVLGAVRRPKLVGFTADMNLVAAISAAGSLGPDAAARHIVIVRGSLSKPQAAAADLTAILSGREPNIRLQPNDIIFVPTRWQAAFSDYTAIPTRLLGHTARLAISSFASSVGANEGSRISQPNTPTQPTTPTPAPAVTTPPATPATSSTPTL